jgi:cytochrome c556
LKRLVTFAACAALPISLMLACSPQKPVQTADTNVKFNTDALDMKEFMGHVVDPASFAYWKGSGTEETAKGTKDLTPTTDEGWEQMETAAAVLIEAGNALQLPGRPREPRADFDKFAQQLTAEAILAKAAAEKHDKAGVYAEGAKVYLICTACHKEYILANNIAAQGNPLPDWPADVKAKQQTYKPKPAT